MTAELILFCITIFVPLLLATRQMMASHSPSTTTPSPPLPRERAMSERAREVIARWVAGHYLDDLPICEDDREGADELLTALHAAGLVVVPVEPTPEMLGAGWRVIMRADWPKFSAGPGLKEAYRAMIHTANGGNNG